MCNIVCLLFNSTKISLIGIVVFVKLLNKCVTEDV